MSSLRKINRVIKRRNNKIELERLEVEREKREEERREKLRKEKEAVIESGNILPTENKSGLGNYKKGIHPSLIFVSAAAILSNINK